MKIAVCSQIHLEICLLTYQKIRIGVGARFPLHLPTKAVLAFLRGPPPDIRYYAFSLCSVWMLEPLV